MAAQGNRSYSARGGAPPVLTSVNIRFRGERNSSQPSDSQTSYLEEDASAVEGRQAPGQFLGKKNQLANDIKCI